MTEPSQYFKGRTVQEQMDEVIGYVDVRSAEVATTAIASDVAQVHQDMLDADADATAAAASAAAAAGTLANAVKKTGEASQSIAGDIAVAGDLSGGTVTVPTPVNNTDAASKKYVDDADALKVSITDIDQYAIGLTGNQTKAGVTTFLSPQEGAWDAHRFYFSTSTGGNWYKIAEIADITSNYEVEMLNFVINSGYYNANNKGGVAFMSLIVPYAGSIEGFITSYKANLADVWTSFAMKIGRRSDGTLEVFAKGRDYATYSFMSYALCVGRRTVTPNECITAVIPTAVPEPQATDYNELITVTI